MADEEEEVTVSTEALKQESTASEKAVPTPVESEKIEQEKTNELSENVEVSTPAEIDRVEQEKPEKILEEEDYQFLEDDEEDLFEDPGAYIQNFEDIISQSSDETISAETDEELFGEDEGGDFVKHRKRKKKPIDQYLPATEDQIKPTGDFAPIQHDAFGTALPPSSIISIHEELELGEEEGEEGGKEEEEEEELEETIAVDRERYYLLYRKLHPERNSKRIRNNFLQRKIAEYFKKRNMEYALKESEEETDSQDKYEKKLDELFELTEIESREKNNIIADLDDMRLQRDEHQQLFNSNFCSMQQREKEVGSGLINTKTGRPVSDKVVERLIRRQNEKMLEISKKRFFYIKLRNAVAEKKMAIHKLDTIGDNLHLIDYEQLKMENTSHSDKVEERDGEMVKLRAKCSGTMQCLAHVREKSAALQTDFVRLSTRFEEVKEELTESRERLNYVKQQRDNYRINITNIIDESGLLTKPHLLCDMEECLGEVKDLENQIENDKKLYEETRESLKALKINVKNFAPTKKSSKKSKVKEKQKGRLTVDHKSLFSID
ncbi:hypothetical protein FQR65_LT03917 [Abscondita terminalis]|nr:hypothetical protein FQR65_LT03917 [Abscondita terminalis]